MPGTGLLVSQYTLTAISNINEISLLTSLCSKTSWRLSLDQSSVEEIYKALQMPARFLLPLHTSQVSRILYIIYNIKLWGLGLPSSTHKGGLPRYLHPFDKGGLPEHYPPILATSPETNAASSSGFHLQRRPQTLADEFLQLLCVPFYHGGLPFSRPVSLSGERKLLFQTVLTTTRYLRESRRYPKSVNEDALILITTPTRVPEKRTISEEEPGP